MIRWAHWVVFLVGAALIVAMADAFASLPEPPPPTLPSRVIRIDINLGDEHVTF